MGRSKPTILLEDTLEDGRAFSVLRVPGIWTVTYRGEPIQVRLGDTHGYPGPKYLRSSWTASPAHARNMATKLNQRFNTDEFEVVELLDYRPVDDSDIGEWIGE